MLGLKLRANSALALKKNRNEDKNAPIILHLHQLHETALPCCQNCKGAPSALLEKNASQEDSKTSRYILAISILPWKDKEQREKYSSTNIVIGDTRHDKRRRNGCGVTEGGR